MLTPGRHEAEQKTVTITAITVDPAVHGLVHGANTEAARQGVKRHIEGAATALYGKVHMAPAGTPLPTVRELQQATYGRRADMSADWQPIGWVASDGIDLDAIPTEDWHRANPPIARHASFTFTQTRAGARQTRGLIFGIYRGHGDKPLIHKGKKP